MDDIRLIGLIGEEDKPALFMENLHKPNVIYRVETEAEMLNEKETETYKGILTAKLDLEALKDIKVENAERC